MKEFNQTNVFVICITALLISVVIGGYICSAARIKHLTENGYEQQLVGSCIGWVKAD